MINFNPHKKNEKVNFQSKIREEKLMKPVKDFLSEVLNRAEFEVTDIGSFKPIELLNDNPNEYQHVAKYGIRIRPVGTANNSKERALELVATKKADGGQISLSQVYARGSREEIIAKLKEPKFLEDLDKYISEASKDFMVED